MGPARLDVEEIIDGRNVFKEQLRIGIGPTVDLAGIPDSSFGVHISTTGYPLLYDDFAGLWGAKWARVFLRWPVVEPTRGQYDFSRIDAVLKKYRSQKMRILAVLGEDAPSWAAQPGPDYYASWKRFVAAAVQHLRENVDAWDVFNEVDVKYSPTQRKGEADWDLSALRAALDTIHATDPSAKTVCCSTGTSQWLVYDDRLLDSPLFTKVDAVSLHPYQPGAPEVRDGPFNYLERINALRDLLRSHNSLKEVWATEANWIIGPSGAPNLTAPGHTEQEQAEYVVRVNLLSMALGVKYFLHSPISHRFRPQPHVATWAAYAAMASRFSSVTHPSFLATGPSVYGITATTTSGVIGSLWTVGVAATIRLAGIRNYRFSDMYGNALAVDSDNVHLSSAPLYFAGPNPSPQLQVLSGASAPQWRPMPPLESWICEKGPSCAKLSNGMRVTTQPSKYGYQLISPPVTTAAGSCQWVRSSLGLEQGAVVLIPVDNLTGKRLDQIAFAAYVPDGQPRSIELRFHAGPSGSFKLIVANANLTDSQSIFAIFDRPEVTDCQ